MFVLQSVSYITPQHITVLDDISTTFFHHSVNWCFGASGCGVTTLLRLLARDIQPTYGKIEVDPITLDLSDDNSLYEYQSCFGILKRCNMQKHLTLRENIALPLVVANTKTSQINERVDGLLNLFALSSFSDDLPSRCSEGVLLQAALARLLVVQPKVLLLDRVFSRLDLTCQNKLFTILNELASYGLTVVAGEDKPPVYQASNVHLVTLS